MASSEVSFIINGSPYTINSSTIPIDTSLNTFIRNVAELSGTKFMCLEGGCGVCIVTIKSQHPVTKIQHSHAVNSCLLPVYSCHQFDITTIEGIGNRFNGYHPLQKQLNNFHGTQCGYCTPGMVMNMYGLMAMRNNKLTMEEIENSFGGNICRCTGYRPILDAFKSFATDASVELLGLDNVMPDIEDLTKNCENRRSVKCKSDCRQMNCKKDLHLIFDDQKVWYKVCYLKDLFMIFSKIENKLYTLLAGNTAHGVYRRNPELEIFIDINDVAELRTHTISDNNIIIGGNVNLTELMVILKDAAEKSTNFKYCDELITHIDLIANVPVRNSGTIAGNLSIKHAHIDFPSDIFIIFETVGAQLTIMEQNDNTIIVSCMDYLQLDMNKKIILNIILPSLQMDRFLCRTYKIMPGAQNAHAYVNAGFLIEMSPDAVGTVLNATLCYGGINTDFVHAMKTEKLLIGKELYTNETLQLAIASLSNEIHPNWILPDASIDYRKHLSIALFYKFILSICPPNIITSIYKSGGEPFLREISSGKQDYATHKDKWPLTEPVLKYEGIIQCSGEAMYVNDISKQKNELWAAYVQATEVNQKIASLDATAALKIPGVAHFFSAKDIPGSNNFSPAGLATSPEEIFIGVNSRILFNGQPVGIVLADSLALANYAATKVKISYVSDTDHSMLTMARSLLNSFIGEDGSDGKQITPTIKDAFDVNDTRRFKRLNFGRQAKKYGTAGTEKVQGRFEMGGQYHYTMETLSTVCVPSEDGGISVFATTQWQDLIQVAISQMLNIQENKIDMLFKRIGGGYGAKITRTSQVACACALGCYLTNRPVRFVLTMESNMTTVGKRYGLISEYEIEINDAGEIQKLINKYSQDHGCSDNDSVLETTDAFFANCYNTTRWTTIPTAVMTDAPSNTWCRSPGTTEGIAMIENIMEHIAIGIGKDPIEVRLANIANTSPIKTMLRQFINDVKFYERKSKIDEFNRLNRWRKRGIAVLPMKYRLDYYGAIPVFVAIYHADGSVVVSHAGNECGQGINTKVAQVTAHVLGIPLEFVSIKQCNNIIGANSTGTGGSQTSEAVCHAVKNACEIILDRIQPVRDKMKNASWPQIISECQNQLIDLSAKFLYKEAQLNAYDIWGCSSAEIEIDILTGNLHLKRVDILEDTGESMNPSVDIGQVEGAFIMGVGYWLTEQLIYNRQTGELLTNRTWTYKPPGAKDIPIDFRITLLRNSSNNIGVLRSKATGEPPLCMSIVVLFALRHALNSARKDAGIKNTWFNMGAPSTPEYLFLNAGNSMEQYKL